MSEKMIPIAAINKDPNLDKDDPYDYRDGSKFTVAFSDSFFLLSVGILYLSS